jgi:hypothetical protein
VIRLRQSLDAALRHPFVGPLLLLFLALMLAFVCLHTIEHGVEGLLFSCVLLVAASVRLVVVVGRVWRTTEADSFLPSRGPPPRLARCDRPPPAARTPVVLPLRL